MLTRATKWKWGWKNTFCWNSTRSKILCQQNLSQIDFRLSSTRSWFIWSRNFFGTVRIKIQIFIARQQQTDRLGCFRSSSINHRMKRKSWDLDQKRFCDCVETVTLWRHKACLWRLWRNRDAVTTVTKPWRCDAVTLASLGAINPGNYEIRTIGPMLEATIAKGQKLSDTPAKPSA